MKPATPDNLTVFRYARVLFGATASLFLLAATITHHMRKVGGATADDIVTNTYVDNVLSSQPNAKAALDYYHEAKTLFCSIAMNLREWYSNDQHFMSEIAEPHLGNGATPSVLGLKWSLDRDRLSCSAGKQQTCGVITRRIILQSIATVFDPCGWFGAVTVRGKMMMQNLGGGMTLWNQRS